VKASRIFIAGAALFITLICWSLSSPINSHQDEKYHLASIWCADGFSDDCDYQGRSESGVETVLIDANLCTPANTEETENKRLLVHRNSGDCKFEATENEPLQKMSVSPNFFYETDTQISAWIKPGHSPSVYYRALNFFGSHNKEQSVIQFRIINSLLFVLLVTAFLLVSEQVIRSSALFGLFATFIPHGLFLVSGVTNSSWSYAGCSMSWAFLYALLNQPFQFNWKTGITVFGWFSSNGLTILSRYDAIIYLVTTNLIVLIFKIYTTNKHRNVYRVILFAVFSSLALAAWVWHNKFQSLVSARVTPSNGLTDLLIAFGNALKLFIAIPMRIFGLQAPGWGPLEASTSVFLTNSIFLVSIVFVLLREIRRTQTFMLLLSFGFLFSVYLLQTYLRHDWTTPFYLVRTSWRHDEFFARYFIPYFPFLFGILAVVSKNFTAVLSSLNFGNSLFTVLTFTQAITLHDISGTFRENPHWYWQNFPIRIEVVSIFGITFFGLFLYLILFPTSKKVGGL